MTMIAHTKTKKELKTKIGEAVDVVLEETSFFGREAKAGATVVCTNHPKRSWFAQVTLDENRRITAVK